MKRSLIASLLITTALSTSALAEMSSADTAALTELNKRLSSQGISTAMPMPDLHEFVKNKTSTSMLPVSIDNGQFFVADGGKTLVRLSDATFVNENGITRGADLVMDMVFSAADTSVFPSHDVKDGVKLRGELYVFTDPTCIYCQYVHKELDTYLAAGVKVTYIPFPRAGLEPGAPGFEQWVRAMCSDSPADAYHDIVVGKSLDAYPAPTAEKRESCVNKVAAGFELGRKAGLSGTPYLILETAEGKKSNVGGYVDANQMLKNANLQ